MERIIDRFDKYMKSKGLSDNKVTVDLSFSIGMLGKSRKEGRDLSRNAIESILNFYTDIENVWLLTGEGEMLKPSSNVLESPNPPKQIVNNEKRGIPYYDVDFIGGYDLVENDQTIAPAYYIDFPEYNDADQWINMTGKSMEPTIWHSDKIAIRELKDWNTYLLYGEIYALVTEQYRTVKILRKSKLGDDFIKLVPINSEFDEQDIPKSIVKKVFSVLGTAKKLF